MKFKLCEILSVTTGKLLNASEVGYIPKDEYDVNGMSGIYSILNYMTGESLMTHQLPLAFKPCKNSIIKQFPVFAEINEDLGILNKSLKEGDAICAICEWFMCIKIKHDLLSEYDILPLKKGEFVHGDIFEDLETLRNG